MMSEIITKLHNDSSVRLDAEQISFIISEWVEKNIQRTPTKVTPFHYFDETDDNKEKIGYNVRFE